MKNYSSCLGLFIFIGVSFCRLAAMPGVADTSTDTGMPDIGAIPTTITPTTTAPSLDQQIATDLAKLSGQTSISGKLTILNSILNYVGKQSVSAQSQSAYSNAVKSFDTYAQRLQPSSITRQQISQILSWLNNYQSSPLFVGNVSSSITFWTGKLTTYGLTSYQRAVQRQQRSQQR